MKIRILFSILGFVINLAVVNQAQCQTPATAVKADNNSLIKLIDNDYQVTVEKDEFETTDAFNKRMRADTGKQFTIIVGIGKGRGYRPIKAFSYDADSGTLKVTLVGDASLELLKIIESTSEAANRIGPGNMLRGKYTKFTLFESEPKKEKEYIGQSAMGVSRTISVYGRKYYGVAILNIPETLGPPLASMSIKMSPEKARDLSTKAAWRITLQTAMMDGQRSLVLNDGDYHKPTIDSPVESYVDGKTITASMMKAELIDSTTGETIATFGHK
jgi:hypothetical protein